MTHLADTPSDHLADYIDNLGFELDDFQAQGCRAVAAGQGVLVCAPTGAGKTVVGEFAVYLALRTGTKCFYTTPIKALSNQKFHDFVEAYGEASVGLLTGDVSINPTADVVVMTTEVLRNMIYAGSDALDRLAYVVMDEVHYLADLSRGAVWEEVILNLDESVAIIGLSATVSNSEEFGRWLTSVRGDTKVIVTDFRPVPLRQYMLVGREVIPLFKDEGRSDELNPELAQRSDLVDATLRKNIQREDDEEPLTVMKTSGGYRYGAKKGRTVNPRLPQADVTRHRAPKPLDRGRMVRRLLAEGMLPAIVFIFSRAGCDGAVGDLLRSRIELTSPEEARTIAVIVDEGVSNLSADELEVLNYRRFRTALCRGFAPHHAGMLPAFRHVVEDLFTRGLLRVVFATETLALGINMPARSVVLEKLVKFNGETHADLTPGQYTQLTGRAGRRGIDVLGNAVVKWSPGMNPKDVAGLASTRSYPLVSTFTPGYNMSVNLVNTLGVDPALRLIGRSFAQYQADADVVDDTAEVERARAEAKAAETAIDDMSKRHPEATNVNIAEYVGLRRELSKVEKESLAFSAEQASREIATALRRLRPGQIIAILGEGRQRKRGPQLAICLKPANDQHDPRPLLVSEDGVVARVGAGRFGVAPTVLGHERLPHHANVSQAKRALKRSRVHRPRSLKSKPRHRPSEKVKALRLAIKDHPAHRIDPAIREEVSAAYHNLQRAEERLAQASSKLTARSDTLATRFRSILDLLVELGYLTADDTSESDLRLTDAGKVLARVHCGSDLLVTQCLEHRVWEGLDPAELAGAVSLCTFENRRDRICPDNIAPTEAMAAAIDDTRRLWGDIITREARHHLDPTASPEAHFALAAHQWTAGAPLEYCLKAAAACGAELTPGDFVRECRQLVDILQQIAAVGADSEEEAARSVAKNARKAIDAIRRGVVAVSV